MLPKWFEVAKTQEGQKEIPGAKDNPQILAYFEDTTYPLKGLHDEVAYCAAGVNWCLDEAGVEGTNSAAARAFLDWGIKLEVPRIGCICVIQQKVSGKDQATGSTSGFHVGFWEKEDSQYVTLFGFNQSDTVKSSNFKCASYTVRGYFWPAEVK